VLVFEPVVVVVVVQEVDTLGLAQPCSEKQIVVGTQPPIPALLRQAEH
jgi:hypothetical protein